MHKRAQRKSMMASALKVFGADFSDDVLTHDEIMFGYQKKQPKLLFMADNIIFKAFNVILLLLAIFTCIVYPIQLGFEPKLPNHYELIQLIIDSCFVADILLNFFLTYSDPNTHFYISSQKIIAKHYLKSFFIIDVLGAIPFETVFGTILGISMKTGVYNILKNIRLFRASKLFKGSRKNNKKITVQNQKLHLFWLFAIFVLIIHWFACIFGAIGIYYQGIGNANNWISGKGLVNAEFSDRYTYALYWSAMSITNVGYGDVVPLNDGERLLSAIILIFGSLLYAVIFGEIFLLINILNKEQTNYNLNADKISHHMKDINVPKKNQDRVHAYFDYVWNKNHGKSSTDQFESIPVRIQNEVAVNVHSRMLKQNVIFNIFSSDKQEELIRKIALHLNFSVGLPSNYIYKCNESANAIYFIARGQVSIADEQDALKEGLSLLSGGEYFGEIPYYHNELVHSQSMRAMTYVDLWFIDYKQFKPIIRANQEMDGLMERIADMRRNQIKPYDDGFQCQRIAEKYKGDMMAARLIKKSKFKMFMRSRSKSRKSGIDFPLMSGSDLASTEEDRDYLDRLKNLEKTLLTMIKRIDVIDEQMTAGLITLS